ncbi:MAG: hypothetical protein JWR81_1677, partial [Pseudonocardia sp.]|nr:hypothetical protein [Pseudonocardia sp.]
MPVAARSSSPGRRATGGAGGVAYDVERTVVFLCDLHAPLEAAEPLTDADRA